MLMPLACPFLAPAFPLASQRTQSTVPLKFSFLSSLWDALRLIMLVLYLLMLATYLAQQYDDARLSAKQYATAARQTVLSIRAGRQKPMADEMLRRAVQERPEAGAAGPAEQAYVAKVRGGGEAGGVFEVVGGMLTL